MTETRRETMGREIKFRALIRINGCASANWEYYSTFDKPVWMGSAFSEIIVKDLQFTGLRDKAGREIFEADIVRFDVAAGRPSEPAVKRQRGEVSFSGGVVSFGSWACLWCVNVEVIGNVHENPELLGGRP